MPLIRATNKTGNGAQYVLNGGEDFFVGAGVTVQSNNSFAVFASDLSPHVIRIDGTISGYQGGLLCGVQNLDGPAYIHVGKTGVLSSRLDVVDSWAIGLQARGSVLENHGVISGYNAISLNAIASLVALSQSQIFNWGTINAVDTAFYRPNNINANETTRIYNMGNVAGAYVLDFSGTFGSTIFFNYGTAVGDIVFGGGAGANNQYVGTHGLLLAAPGSSGPAQVSAKSAAFFVAPGRSAEHFDFSGMPAFGRATVSFAASPTGVRFALDESLPQAGAVLVGDIFTGIQMVKNLTGSQYGNDTLRGGAGGENIRGLSGQDRLEGLAGDDSLLGGDGRDYLSGGDGADKLVGDDDNHGGRDTLWGGAGADTFYLLRTNYPGDIIRDFNAVDDRLYIQVNGGPGNFAFPINVGTQARYATADEFRLTSGHHRAGDLSDRFIYDTKKTQLWFDPDGTGRKKAIMIADLQPGAVLTAEDIFLSPGIFL